MLYQVKDISINCGFNVDEMVEQFRPELDVLPNLPAPYIASKFQKEIYTKYGIYDAYVKIKKQANDMTKKFLPVVKKMIQDSEDKIFTAIKFAIIGNIIDYGLVHGNDVEKKFHELINSPDIERRIKKDFFKIEEFKEKLSKSKKILYLADNAGEIVYDFEFVKLIKSIYPDVEIRFVVRGGPMQNDATMEDAIDAGIPDCITMLDSGLAMPGTDIENCSKSLKDSFNWAELIISKGQGNFETLEELKDSRIFFILIAKCITVANFLGFDIGDFVLSNNL